MPEAPELAPETYARWRASELGAITERAEERIVFDLAGPVRGLRVLDVGTGDGTYAIGAARRGARVTGVDVSPAMLAAASSRAESAGVSLDLREASVEKLPFEDATFDVVFAVTVLCFVPEAGAAVREVARVLAPGGRLVLGELHRFSTWAGKRRVSSWVGPSVWRRVRFWSRAELESLVRLAGLKVADARSAVFFPPNAVAARLMAPLEGVLSRARAPGAAFLALSADKPRTHP